MPGVFAQAVGYQSLALAADYLTGPRQFNVTKLNVTAPGFALDGSGIVSLNDNGAPGLVAKARIPAMPVRTLLRYWPLPVAPGARSWIDENIFAGEMGPLEAQTNFPPGMLDQDMLPEESLKLTFAMKEHRRQLHQGSHPRHRGDGRRHPDRRYLQGQFHQRPYRSPDARGAAPP